MEMKRPSNVPWVKTTGSEVMLSLDSSGRRCNNKGNGSLYDPTFGICYYFCRYEKVIDDMKAKDQANRRGVVGASANKRRTPLPSSSKTSTSKLELQLGWE